MNIQRHIAIILSCYACVTLAQTPTQQASSANGPAYQATVISSVSVDGMSFKKGESFFVESIDKITATANTTRNGKIYRIPLQSLDIQREASPQAGNERLIVIIKAEYGVPRLRIVNVTRKVQELVNQTPGGTVPVILASRALLPKQTARDGRFAGTTTLSGFADSSGNVIVSGNNATSALLTISYTVNGQPHTAHGVEGEKVYLK